VALALLVLAGAFNIAFTSMAQTLVQLLAPPALRGRVVGLFNTAILGLRAGSGVTVGVVGALVNVATGRSRSARGPSSPSPPSSSCARSSVRATGPR
jgi:hypothetical protein